MASFLSRIGRALAGQGGGETASAGEAVEYQGFTIVPSPRKEGGQWLTAGSISKQIGEETHTHEFVRADRHASKDAADSFSVSKARQIIDEQGDRLFKS